jgi:ribosomal protein S18 acetylase RimI-like enzyme
MEIIEYNENHMNGVKDLLCELQEYIISLDEYKIQTISDNYRDEYFNYMIENIRNNDGIIYVAIEDSNVLGFVVGTISKPDRICELTVDSSIKGRVEELCVTSKIRGNGIGKLLMDKIEEYLKNKGCKYIFIEVFGPNTRALNFYNKSGYNLRNLEVMKKIID